MSRELIFECELGTTWTGQIKIKHITKDSCLAEVNARDTNFLVAVTCYFEGFGMTEYCMTECYYNFGCKLSTLSIEYNEEQLEKYISNRIDRRSLACAVMTIMDEMEKERRSNETI